MEEFKMTNLTTEMILNMSYRELQKEAKAKGIKANQSAGLLRILLDPSTDEKKEEVKEVDMSAPDTDDFFEEDDTTSTNEEASEPEASEQPIQTYTKLIEFVSSTAIAVHYKYRGIDVVVGWSKDDFKMHVWSKRKGSKLTSYGSMIKAMSHFKKGVHGDVGLVVNALKRIKLMPAKIKMLQAQLKAANEVSGNQVSPENVSPVKTEEKRSRANRGVAEAMWVKNFRDEFELIHERQPTAMEILAAKQSRAS